MDFESKSVDQILDDKLMELKHVEDKISILNEITNKVLLLQKIWKNLVQFCCTTILLHKNQSPRGILQIFEKCKEKKLWWSQLFQQTPTRAISIRILQN